MLCEGVSECICGCGFGFILEKVLTYSLRVSSGTGKQYLAVVWRYYATLLFSVEGQKRKENDVLVGFFASSPTKPCLLLSVYTLLSLL